MYQVKESWSSRSQAERDEMTDKEDEQKIIALVKKYGRKKVSDAEDEARKERKNRLSNKKITWRELQRRIDSSKNRLKPGEVRKWDKEKNKWVSNKEDVNEEPNWNDGVNVRWNLGPNKKEVSLNVNGATIASRKTEKWTGKTKVKTAVDKGLIDFKNTQDPAKNLSGMKK